MASKGLKLAVKYSYRPFILGFCGPQKSRCRTILTNYLLGAKVKEKEVEDVLRQFVSAFPYYTLIAWKNNIKDVFSEKVVEAYWTGNSLLKKVKRQDIATMILAYFVRLGWMDIKKAREIIMKLPQGVVPHHIFHVLFMGSVTDTIEIKGKAKDHCRIGWGKVLEVKENKLVVETNPLRVEGKPRLGAKVKKEIDWEPNFRIKIRKEDWVSFHWNFLSDRLNKIQLKNLEQYTKQNLKLYAKKK